MMRWGDGERVRTQTRRTARILLAVDSSDLHFEAVEVFARRNEENLSVRAAEANVGGPRFLNVDVFNLFTVGTENGDAFSREIHIALVVDSHAVGAEFAEQVFAFE